ncbi:MAG: hypothetical protein QOI77_3180 [Blastocatellia bacterium]|jgi:hypothetical protein|nr:hypothetical protein [Blastocatellia bacterium]
MFAHRPSPQPLSQRERESNSTLNPCWLVHSGLNPTETHFFGTKKTMGRVYC